MDEPIILERTDPYALPWEVNITEQDIQFDEAKVGLGGEYMSIRVAQFRELLKHVPEDWLIQALVEQTVRRPLSK